MPDKNFNAAIAVLPPDIRRAAMALDEGWKNKCEEIRLRVGYEPTVLLPEGERSFRKRPVTRVEIASVMEAATGASIHSAMDTLKRGFVTVSGGVRIGVCGTAVSDRNGVMIVKDYSSLCIRVPGEAKGVAGGVFDILSRDIDSTIIIAPPGGGKTTLLREIIRLFSEKGVRTALCDERGEVAAVCNAQPQFDLGAHTDIITGAPKAEAVMMVLRSMNPQIIAMDEITEQCDVEACASAMACGVALLATAHGDGPKSLSDRPVYKRMLEQKIFRRAVVIRRGENGREYSVEEIGRE